MTREHTPRPGCCVPHDIPPDDGCTWCGHPDTGHRVRLAVDPDVGHHHWAPPTEQQRADRAALRDRHPLPGARR